MAEQPEIPPMPPPDDPRLSPEWCHTHDCHSSECQPDRH
jgi:hypothetical protein